MELTLIDPAQGYLAHRIEINFLIALGSNKNLHNEIDRVYTSNKLEFYDAYRNSSYKNNRLFYSFPTAYTERMIKVTGIYCWCSEKQQDEVILKLIKVGYRKVWNFYSNHKVVDLDDFRSQIFNSIQKFNKTTEQEFESPESILFFLCYNSGITCELGSDGDFIRKKFLSDYEFENGSSVLNELSPQYKEKIKELREVYWLSSKSKYKTLNQLLDSIQIKVIKESKFHDDKSNRIKRIDNYAEIFFNRFRVFGINADVLTEGLTLTLDDFDQFSEAFYREQSDGSLKEEECDFFIIACLYIKALVVEYENTRKIYLSSAKEDNYLDTLKLKTEIEAKAELFHKEKANFKSEIARLEDSALNYQNDAIRWQREATRIQQELNQADLDKKELLALRKYIFEQQTLSEDSNDDLDDYSRALELLRNHNYVIAGGHPNLVKGLKEILPNITFLDMDSLHKDLRFLDNQEAVFINTAYLSHAFYYKVMSRMEMNKTKLFYFSSSSVRGVVLKMRNLLGI